MSVKGTAAVGSSRSTEAGMQLTSGDEEKVSNIVEVCNVTFDEALRVLEACRKDETLAIERFLSGTEDTTWLEVPKKKRPSSHLKPRKILRSQHNATRALSVEEPKSRAGTSYCPEHSSVQTSGRTASKGMTRLHGEQGQNASRTVQRQTKQRPKVRENVARSSRSPDAGPSNLNHSWGSQAGKNSLQNIGPSSKRLLRRTTQSDIDSRSPQNAFHHAEKESAAWLNGAHRHNRVWISESSNGPSKSPPWKQTVNSPKSTLPEELPAIPCQPAGQTIQAHEGIAKRKKAPDPQEKRGVLSYVAAAASGTIGKQTEKPEIPGAETIKENLLDRAKAPHVHKLAAPRFHERIVSDLQEKMNEISLQSIAAADTKNDESTNPDSDQLHSKILVSPTVWENASSAQSAIADEKDSDNAGIEHHEDSTPHDPCGKHFSLQFGSFGLNGLDEMELWTEKTSSAQKHSPVAMSNGIQHKSSSDAKTDCALPMEPVIGTPQSSGMRTPKSAKAAEIPGDEAKPDRRQIRRQTSVSAGAVHGGSMVPMLATGHGGSFPAPNYGTPFMIPPLHGYSPVLGNFEAAAESGNSCHGSLVPPGSMPMYDQQGLPSGGSAGTKYGNIPGLGNMNRSHGHGGLRKENLTGVEVEKTTIGPTATTMGTESLNASYLLPGYPSLQYPMYPYPNASPYAAPGITAHGPNAFPFHAGGQIPSHGGRNMFGFEDATVQLGTTSRTPQEVGESMYSAGTFFNSVGAHHVAQKPFQEIGFKSPRNVRTNGGSVGGVNITGVVHGIHYSDYVSNPVPSSSNVAIPAPAQGEWKSQPHSGTCAEGVLPAGAGVQAGGSSGTAAYVVPNGAQGAYWTAAHHTGYYS